MPETWRSDGELLSNIFSALREPRGSGLEAGRSVELDMNELIDRLVREYLRRMPITEGKYQIYRRFARHDWPGDTFVIGKTKDGFLLQLNLRNDEHRRTHYYGELDERYELALLRETIREGDVFWDIGSNIGYYTCLAALRAGTSGRVIAFEPAPKTREFLERNLKLNGFDNVTVMSVAIGERDDITAIHMSDPLLGEGTASLKASAAQTHKIDVQVRCLDNLASSLPAPDIVKVDVEGVFWQLWVGGAKFFSRHAPIVMAELKGEPFETTQGKLGNAISALGYAIYEINKHSIRRVDDPAKSKRRNFILVKEGTPAFARLTHRIAAIS